MKAENKETIVTKTAEVLLKLDHTKVPEGYLKENGNYVETNDSCQIEYLDKAGAPVTAITHRIVNDLKEIGNPWLPVITPTPVTPTPVTPTPVIPTPVAPTPVIPTPVAPTPVAPTPVAPTPEQEEIPEEEVPEGTTPEEEIPEEEIPEETIPEGTVENGELPKTGTIPVELFYGLGSVIVGFGGMTIAKKKKK